MGSCIGAARPSRWTHRKPPSASPRGSTEGLLLGSTLTASKDGGNAETDDAGQAVVIEMAPDQDWSVSASAQLVDAESEDDSDGEGHAEGLSNEGEKRSHPGTSARQDEAPENEESWNVAKKALATGTSAFAVFKASRYGVLVLERYLPLQDVVSDILVTFGKEGWPLCSSDGLYWTNNIWWTRISIALVGTTYVLLFVLAFPLVHKAMKLKLQEWMTGYSKTASWTAAAIWLVSGLPALMLSDIVLLIACPLAPPKQSWLLNLMRLRTIVETCVESPGQTILQSRILYVNIMNGTAEFSAKKLATLLFSIGTSLLCIALTLLDFHKMARAQNISLVECVKDQLLVGLERKAPLLHLLKVRDRIDYSEEGALSDEFMKQIADVLSTCGQINEIIFSLENGLSINGLELLLKAFAPLSKADTFRAKVALPSGGSLDYSHKELSFHDGTRQELRWACSCLEPQVLDMSNISDSELAEDEETSLTGGSSIPEIEEIRVTGGGCDSLVRNLISTRTKKVSADEMSTATAWMIFQQTGELAAPRRWLKEPSAEIAYQSNLPTDTIVAFIDRLRSDQGSIGRKPQVFYMTSEKEVIDLLSDSIKVKKPTAAEADLVLRAGASEVEFVSPKLTKTRIGSCLEVAKARRQELSSFRWLITYGEESISAFEQHCSLKVPTRRLLGWVEAFAPQSLQLVRPIPEAEANTCWETAKRISDRRGDFELSIEHSTLLSFDKNALPQNQVLLAKVPRAEVGDFLQKVLCNVRLVRALKDVRIEDPSHGVEGAQNELRLKLDWRQFADDEIAMCCLHIAKASEELGSRTVCQLALTVSIAAEGCKHLAQLQQLQSLTIESGNNIAAEGCKHLAQLQQLQSLTIGWGNNIAAEGCKHLAQLQQLQSLTIGGDNKIAAEGCKHLAQLQQLQSLTIDERDNNIAAEAAAPYLNQLRSRGGAVRV